MIERLGDLVINVYSSLNSWIDYIFVLDDKANYDRAAEIISKAYDDWFNLLDDGVNDIPIAEYISESLREAGINSTIYINTFSEESVYTYHQNDIIKSKEYYEKLYPAGTVVELTEAINDPYKPKPAGARFMINSIDDMLQLHGSWITPESGSMAISIENDKFKIVGKDKEYE